MTLEELEKKYALRILAYVRDNPNTGYIPVCDEVTKNPAQRRTAFLRIKGLADAGYLSLTADPEKKLTVTINLTDKGKKIADAIRCIE